MQSAYDGRMQPVQDSRQPADGPGGRQRASRSIGGVVVAGIAVVAVLAVAVVLFGLAFVGVSPSEPSSQPQRSIPAPANAPAGDFFTLLLPGDSDGPVAQDLFARLQGGESFMGEVVVGSVVHVAQAETAWGTVDILEWAENGALPDGPRELMQCRGRFEESGSVAGCGPADAAGEIATPAISWGTGVTARLSVNDGSPDAAWMVVETQFGVRIVSNVIAGSGYVEWPTDSGDPRLVTLFDAEMNELWSDVPSRL